MVKISLNQCGILKIVIYHYAPHPTSMTTHDSQFFFCYATHLLIFNNLTLYAFIIPKHFNQTYKSSLTRLGYKATTYNPFDSVPDVMVWVKMHLTNVRLYDVTCIDDVF